MKKYLNIIVAAALIVLGVLEYGSNRPRPLSECFPEGAWENASVTVFAPVPGEEEESLDLAVTPEKMKKAMEEITVFRQSAKKGWNCGYLAVRIFIDGEPVAAEIGEDGSVAVEKDRGGWTFWRAADGTLYQYLTRS